MYVRAMNKPMKPLVLPIGLVAPFFSTVFRLMTFEYLPARIPNVAFHVNYGTPDYNRGRHIGTIALGGWVSPCFLTHLLRTRDLVV